MGKILNYVMTEHDHSIATFKEFLPAKAVCSHYPHILWIQAPLHNGFKNNDLRRMFNACLDDVIRLHTNTHTLMLKRVWDPKNHNLFILESGCFMAEGMRDYWEAVDHTACYFDSVVLPKKVQDKRKNLKMNNHSTTDQKDRFWWQNPSLNVNTDVGVFRKLPPPP